MAMSAALRCSFYSFRNKASILVSHLRPSTKVPLLRRFLSYPAHEVVGMPSLSPTMESGTIAAWKVNEGDSFAAGDAFCSIETDKATVDFEAQDDGVVAKILAPASSREIKCGEPILITVSSKEDTAAFFNYVASSAASAAVPVDASGDTSHATTTPLPAPPKSLSTASTIFQTGSRVIASPLAHMLAKDLGYDIKEIVGTGPGGRIVAADVKEFVRARVPERTTIATIPTASETTDQYTGIAVAAQPVAGGGYTDFPLSESAQEIAARLTLSKQRVPHYYLTVDICMDDLLDVRSKLNSGIGNDGYQLGIYELLLKAAAVSMKTVPSVNASWMNSVVRVYDSVDINVVVGNGDALYAPVIRDCGSIGLKSLSAALANGIACVDATADDDVKKEFSALGTFTVINLGMYGIKSCAPIIREPQSCALALGALENRVVPNDDETSSQQYKQCIFMTATLSCDHRVVDGAVGAQWLSAFKAHIENPTTLLL